jgi:AcrR family transcriptional regulator
MPRLWTATIAAHRNQVRGAIMDSTAELVLTLGLRAVTMSQVAEATGIGRATLYKYFPSVEAILLAWHERQVASHLHHLLEVREEADEAGRQLEAVLRAYGVMLYETQGLDADLVASLHRDEHLAAGRERLHTLVRDLVEVGARQGVLRDDIPSDELATYCLHALSAARGMRSAAAVKRLVTVTLSGLRPA